MASLRSFRWLLASSKSSSALNPSSPCCSNLRSQRRVNVASFVPARCASTIPKVNQERLMNDLHYTCQWGTGERWGDASTETGMSRLSLTDADKKVRDWFAETTQSLGCSLTIDEMGNMFAIRPGKKEGKPTYAGSHLDTQPTGGRYDGILGVHSAVEMLKCLHDAKVETEYPIGVVNWTNEEGARFPKSMVSSGVWAGSISLKDAHNLASVTRGDTKSTMKSELERIGYLGSTPCNNEATPMAAHFELHIEQGPILENSGQKVGVVKGVQSYRWYTITVKGRDCHTGTTDLHSRADALLNASKMVVAARDIAHSKGTLASVGIIDAQPGSTNTVPGVVNFSLDIRAAELDKVLDTEATIREAFDAIAAGSEHPSIPSSFSGPAHPDETSVEWRLDFESAAVKFHEDCTSCIAESARQVVGQDMMRDMMSGAGHDSVYTSKHVPTAMIFVPSKNGVSHNPKEYTKPEECAIGAEVLMGAVLRYDAKRTS